MNLKNLMTIKAIIVVVFGLLFILAPNAAVSSYGVTLNPAGSAIAQLLGAAFILLGIMLWFARNANRSEVALKAIVLAVFVGDTIGFIISLMSQLSGVYNALGWVDTTIYLLLAVGFGYFQFIKPAAS